MPASSLFSLPGGGCHSLYARSGDHVVCLEGRIAVGEARAGGLDPWHRIESALHAGEAHCFHETGVVTLSAARDSRLVYLHAQPVWRQRMARAVQHISKWCMIRFIRRGVEQSGSSSGS